MPRMSKLILASWIVVAVCVVAAVVDLLVRPMHWERTIAAAVVLGVIAATVAVVQSRRAPAR
jgi:hypothetical protein